MQRQKAGWGVLSFQPHLSSKSLRMPPLTLRRHKLARYDQGLYGLSFYSLTINPDADMVTSGAQDTRELQQSHSWSLYYTTHPFVTPEPWLSSPELIALSGVSDPKYLSPPIFILASPSQPTTLTQVPSLLLLAQFCGKKNPGTKPQHPGGWANASPQP